MPVGHRLTGSNSVVDANIEAVGTQLVGKVISYAGHVFPEFSQLFWWQIENGSDVPFWNDKRVPLRDRKRVEEGQRDAVFSKYTFGRQISELTRRPIHSEQATQNHASWPVPASGVE